MHHRRMETSDLRLLRDVVAAGSLSAVAKARAQAVSTVTRRLDGLEALLGLTLLVRGRDGVRPTEEGAQVLRAAEPLLRQTDGLARAVDAMKHGRPREVVVSATEIVISDILGPAVPRAPAGVRLNLRSQGAVVSLAGREADLAVRMIAPQGASLIARKLPALEMGLFCSAAYLARRSPAALQLAEERLLVYDDSWGALPEQAWIDAECARAVLVRTNSTRTLINMTLASAGVALLPVAFALPVGLIRVAPDVKPPPRTPWLVAHADLRRRPDLRAVQRWIREAFATALSAGEGPLAAAGLAYRVSARSDDEGLAVAGVACSPAPCPARSRPPC